MRYTPFGSVSTDCDSWLSRYSSTVQPASARSRESWALSKLASYQADPFSTARTGVPGPPGDRMLPTAIETLARVVRSEEHTSELQSRSDLVCRLLLEKKKTVILNDHIRDHIS